MMKNTVYFVCSLLVLLSLSNQVIARSDQQNLNPSCQIPNQEDSYKLALSWQPAFCESHKAKPECKITDKKAYQATNFTLHGLWPNKRECGINYGLCGQYKRQAKSFCDYQALPLKPETIKLLEQVMPSVAGNSCLDRHEWYKHGTCQTDWDADQYFNTAARLVKEFNDSGMSVFMQQHVGQTITANEFLNAVDKSFGPPASQRLQLGCDRNGNLVDVFINLPAQISDTAKLADLIQQAPKNFNNRCGKQFTIDAIGYSR